MSDFDYARAWSEVAAPAFEVLPQNVRDLYDRVAREACDCSQKMTGDLDLEWPADSDLRVAFDKIPYEVLSQAALVIQDFGHWSPFPAISRYGAGAHWRFAKYATQTLRAKLGIVEKRSAFRIVDGELRYAHETRDSWRWETVGLATIENLERCKKIVAGTDDAPDPSVGFLARVGFEVEAGTKEAPEGFPDGTSSYSCVFRFERRKLTVPYFMGPAHTEEPKKDDVLSNLFSDAGSADRSFEEWCSDLGYDSDSRRALRIFKACERTGAGLHRLFGDAFDKYEAIFAGAYSKGHADIFEARAEKMKAECMPDPDSFVGKLLRAGELYRTDAKYDPSAKPAPNPIAQRFMEARGLLPSKASMIDISKVESSDSLAYIYGFKRGVNGDPLPGGGIAPEYKRGHEHGKRVRAGTDPNPEWHKKA